MQNLDEQIDLPQDLVERIDDSQLAGALRKMRARHLSHLLSQHLAEHGFDDAVAWSHYGMAGPTVTCAIEGSGPDPERLPQLGVQLQMDNHSGGQFRLMGIMPHLSSVNGGDREAREAWARTNTPWAFDCDHLTSNPGLVGPSRPKSDAPSSPLKFNSYNPDFLYRYFKLSNLTVGNFLEATVRHLAHLHTRIPVDDNETTEAPSTAT